MSKIEDLEDLIEAFRREIKGAPHTASAAAEWAIKRGVHPVRQEDMISFLAAKLSAHMGQTKVTDPKGRKVRSHFPVPGEDGAWLWAGMSAPRKHKVESLQYRRKMMVDDAFQLKQCVDSLNDTYPNEEPLQLSLDLRMDVAILEQEKRMNPKGIRRGRKPGAQSNQDKAPYQRSSTNAH